MATVLFNLANLYDDQGRYAEVEPLYQRSLAIDEKALGPDHPRVAANLNNLALFYNNQGRFAEALDWMIIFQNMLIHAGICGREAQ